MTNQSTNRYNPLYFMKALLSGESLVIEFLEKLNIKNSTLSKYLNILKEAGFTIRKRGNKIEILRYAKKVKLEEYELKVFSYLYLLSYLALSTSEFKQANHIFEKMLSMSCVEDLREVLELFDKYKQLSFFKYYNDKMEILKKYLNGDERIIITTKNQEEISIVPIEFNWKGLNIYLKYSNKQNEVCLISLDEIIKIAEDKKSFYIRTERDTIFELSGKLAKTYLLREEERVIDVVKDKIVISNSSLDKEKLFKRLLRYDKYCKITFPQCDVEKFKEIINKSLANINKIAENVK